LKVYCEDCEYHEFDLGIHGCLNDSLDGEDTWLCKELDPKLMNKNNDCLGFKPRDER
jgi:hypothetical protein